ncbi:hypothetical protein [Argonema antarcticum]|uniref:hypothetical protein n=1 Tax=Argonema antarcticum TaxID=2942763 RepID=UPI002012985D|nr:hypothetical protein [Argonema antarcticum]MCL1474258.1 hypothetical protein [Argonema antarcticum A004/B2]
MKKTYIFGVLAVATLGMLPLPAMAQSYNSRGGDSAVSQQSSQTATVTGNSNNVKKHINVINIDRSGRGGRQRFGGNRGVVQNQNQGVDVRGDRNTVRQNGRQFNSDRSNPGFVDRSI